VRAPWEGPAGVLDGKATAAAIKAELKERGARLRAAGAARGAGCAAPAAPCTAPRIVMPGRPLPIPRKTPGKVDSPAKYCGILWPA